MGILARVVGNVVVFSFCAVGAYITTKKVFGWYIDSRHPSKTVVEHG